MQCLIQIQVIEALQATDPAPSQNIISTIPVTSKPSIISLLPEELRQQIIGELNYYDAWALKQTSKLFERVVEIPTVKSFLRWPNGETLTILREWDVIPITHEVCYYCRHFLHFSCYSRAQRRDFAIRREYFEYEGWNIKNQFCLKCGVARGEYPPGQRIPTGFGDYGTTSEAVVVCCCCAAITDFNCRVCETCGLPWNRCITAQETPTLSANAYPGNLSERSV